MLDVGWGDLIDYLGDDPHTKSIVIYMESIGDARSFLSAAREVALTKPIIVIKAGRTEAAAKAAASHTGSLTGSDEVLDAAFRRVGVLRVDSISEVFDMAEVLAKQPRPKGPRLTIVTNAGGPGVLATDALIENQGELAELSPETIDALERFLPAAWSHSNPIDILGDADPERYASTLEIAAKDPNSDGLLVILTPQAMTDPTATAEQLRQYAKIEGKPVLASWMGGERSRPASRSSTRRASPRSRIPTRPPTSSRSCGGRPTTSRACTRRPTSPADRRDRDSVPRERPRRSSPRPGRGPDRAHRTRVEADCWPPTASRPSRPRIADDRGRRRRGRGVDRLSRSSSSSTPRRSRTRPTSAACSSTCQTPKPCARPISAIEPSVASHGRRRALPGRDRPADGQARRLRADRRQQPRPAVRPGAPLRHRRPARRGLQGPLARLCRRSIPPWPGG